VALNPAYQGTTSPGARRRWTFSLNNRSTFSSLAQVTGDVLYGIKNFLVSTVGGWVVKYSCDGTTGPSSAGDHTDRWSSSANAQTRGANTSTAQSWVVLTDVDGVDCMISFTGAGDNTIRFAYSMGGLYTPAGTATFPATATDEALATSGSDFVDASTTGDRIWNVMADKRSFRAWVYRNGVGVGSILGIEPVSTALLPPATSTPRFAMLFILTSNGFATSAPVNTQIGVSRVSIGSTGATAAAKWQEESDPTISGGAELQGGYAGVARAMSVWSDTAGSQGKIGNLIDWWWSGESSITPGTMTWDRKWLYFQGLLWPWDGSTTPVLA
jgi:hypothetical protein